MALLWLADVLREAGVPVVEHSGWKTHDVDGAWNPTYGVVHATAAPRTQKDSVQVGVVRNGRADLPGPIANAVIRRDGVWEVVSAGRCNSTTVGTAGPYKGWGNTNALSTEGCNDNRGEPWSDVQYRSYVRGWAAWCRRLGWDAERLVGHKEHTPGRKSDPTFDMDQFRADVAAVLAGKDNDVLTDKQNKILSAVGAQMDALVSLKLSIDTPWAANPKGKQQIGLVQALTEIRSMVRSLAGEPAEEIVAEVRAQGEQTRAALEAQPAAIAAAVVAALPGDRDDITVAELEEAVRAVVRDGVGVGASD